MACLCVHHFLPVTSILEGEYAENEVRKDFTKSELVAIAASLAELIKERKGQPPKNIDERIPETDPEIPKGKETRDFIAEKVGLGTGRTRTDAQKCGG